MQADSYNNDMQITSTVPKLSLCRISEYINSHQGITYVHLIYEAKKRKDDKAFSSTMNSTRQKPTSRRHTAIHIIHGQDVKILNPKIVDQQQNLG
jgi:Ser-tRNA(Ala) deacylase AlaX